MKYSSHQLQLKAYNILLHAKFMVNFCTPWNTNLFKIYMPNSLCLSFQFHDNNSVTISMSENWIGLTACFRNGKISYTSLEFWWLTFYHNCNEILQAKIRPFNSNERVYRKPIDRRFKTLPNEVSGSFLRLTTPELWTFFLEPVLPFFG